MSFALLLDFTGYIEYLLLVLFSSVVGIGYIVRHKRITVYVIAHKNTLHSQCRVVLYLCRYNFKELIFIYRLREIISLQIINSPFGEIIGHFLGFNALGYNHLIIKKNPDIPLCFGISGF